MIQNRNILCISNMMWEGDFANTVVELMSVFAKKNTILYVDNPYTVKDLIDGLRGKKKVPFKKIFGFQSRLKTIQLDNGGEVHVLTVPLTLTINFLPNGFLYNSLLKFNGWIITHSIKKYLHKLNMQNDLINITAFSPGVGLVTGKRFNEKLLIYHCYDIIEAAAWLKKHGARQEKEFMQMADATIVTSQGLLEKKQEYCKVCLLVKNAANINLFRSAYKDELNERKVVGYIGSIDDRLDYQLLDYTISNSPEIEYVFIGRIVDKEGEAILRKHPNVKLEGSKNLKDLPDYVKHFSLGIIPFAQNEFTKGIYPLKINEYLAAGLPVVSTNFSYLSDFTGVIDVADTKEQFSQYIQKAIASDSIEKKQQRLSVAQQNSWEDRVEKFSEIITMLENSVHSK